jgi:hypothetical protein
LPWPRFPKTEKSLFFKKNRDVWLRDQLSLTGARGSKSPMLADRISSKSNSFDLAAVFEKALISLKSYGRGYFVRWLA